MCKVDCTFTHCTTWFIVQDTRQSCNVEIHVFRCFQQGASITEQSSSPVEVCGGFQACQMVMIAHSPRTCWGPRSRPRSLSHIAYTPMAWLLAACHIAHVSVKHSVSGNCHHSSLHHPSLRRPSCIHSTTSLFPPANFLCGGLNGAEPQTSGSSCRRRNRVNQLASAGGKTILAAARATARLSRMGK